MEAFGEDLASGAAAQGISMEVMHRAWPRPASTRCHNGAIITLLLVCGLSHRES
jgi:hypothetical protein